jgi:hypothetical protein
MLPKEWKALSDPGLNLIVCLELRSQELGLVVPAKNRLLI